MQTHLSEFISVKDAARLAGKHPNTIKRWAHAGHFVAIRPGGTPNSPLSIDRASFVTYLRSTAITSSDAHASNKPQKPSARVRDELRLVTALAWPPRATIRYEGTAALVRNGGKLICLTSAHLLSQTIGQSPEG